MNIIIEYLNAHLPGAWATVIVFILSFVEFSKIKLNPISSFLSFIGKKCNTDLYERMESFEQKQSEMTNGFENVQGVMERRFREIDCNMDSKFDELNKKVDEVIDKRDFDVAMTSRYRLIRAADEIIGGHKISDDHLQQLGEDTEIYKEYCRKHPDYKNHKGAKSMEIVLNYEDRKRLGGMKNE